MTFIFTMKQAIRVDKSENFILNLTLIRFFLENTWFVGWLPQFQDGGILCIRCFLVMFDWFVKFYWWDMQKKSVHIRKTKENNRNCVKFRGQVTSQQAQWAILRFAFVCGWEMNVSQMACFHSVLAWRLVVFSRKTVRHLQRAEGFKMADSATRMWLHHELGAKSSARILCFKTVGESFLNLVL